MAFAAVTMASVTNEFLFEPPNGVRRQGRVPFQGARRIALYRRHLLRLSDRRFRPRRQCRSQSGLEQGAQCAARHRCTRCARSRPRVPAASCRNGVSSTSTDARSKNARSTTSATIRAAGHGTRPRPKAWRAGHRRTLCHGHDQVDQPDARHADVEEQQDRRRRRRAAGDDQPAARRRSRLRACAAAMCSTTASGSSCIRTRR